MYVHCAYMCVHTYVRVYSTDSIRDNLLLLYEPMYATVHNTIRRNTNTLNVEMVRRTRLQTIFRFSFQKSHEQCCVYRLWNSKTVIENNNRTTIRRNKTFSRTPGIFRTLAPQRKTNSDRFYTYKSQRDHLFKRPRPKTRRFCNGTK